jgi:hypothetical protein
LSVPLSVSPATFGFEPLFDFTFTIGATMVKATQSGLN